MPCETCGQSNCLRPSEPAGPVEALVAAVRTGRHYECASCGARRWHPLGPKDPVRQSWTLLSGPSQW